MVNCSLGSGLDDFNVYIAKRFISFSPEIIQLPLTGHDVQNAQEKPRFQNKLCDHLNIEKHKTQSSPSETSKAHRQPLPAPTQAHSTETAPAVFSLDIFPELILCVIQSFLMILDSSSKHNFPSVPPTVLRENDVVSYMTDTWGRVYFVVLQPNRPTKCPFMHADEILDTLL